ncbi:hypothetical protein Tco_0693859, partial [Tanacetum coccineum]
MEKVLIGPVTQKMNSRTMLSWLTTVQVQMQRQAVPINAARKVNTIKPIVTNARPKAGFQNSVSPFRNLSNGCEKCLPVWRKLLIEEVYGAQAIQSFDQLRPEEPLVKDEEASDVDFALVLALNTAGRLLEKTDGEYSFMRYPAFLLEASIHYALNLKITLRLCQKRENIFMGKVTNHLFSYNCGSTTKDEGDTLERQSKPQPIPSPPHLSEDQHETQTDPSPRPSPTTHIPDSILEGSGGNHGGQSSSDRSLSGNKGGMTLQISTEDPLSTAQPNVSTNKPEDSTDKPDE